MVSSIRLPSVRDVLRLSTAIVTSLVLDSILNLIDTAVVGRLGASSQAGAGLGGLYALVAGGLLLSVGIGTQTFAAHPVGAGDMQGAQRALRAGLSWTLVIGLPLSLLAAWEAHPILESLSSDTGVRIQAERFAAWRCVLLPISMLTGTLRGYANAWGTPNIYVPSMLVVLVANALFAPALALCTPLGVAGAALAAGLAQALGCLVLALPPAKNRFAGFGVSFCTADLRALARLVIPAGLTSGFLSLGYLAFLTLVGKLGPVPLASASILITLCSVGLLISIGVGTSAASLVARHLGAAQPAHAKAAGWAGAKGALLVVGAVALPLLLGEPTVRLLSADPQVIAQTATLAPALAVLLPLDAVGIALLLALLAAKDAAFPSAVSLLLHWAVFLPLTWWLLEHQGATLTTVMAAYGAYRLVFTGAMLGRFAVRA